MKSEDFKQFIYEHYNNIEMKKINSVEDFKKLEQLFLAIYFNDVDKVIEFKNDNLELYNTKSSFFIDEELYLDLVHLTYFNYIIWFDKNWSSDIMPMVQRIRTRINDMIDFWKSEGVFQDIKTKISYNQYIEYFNLYYSSTEEEVLLNTISFYLQKGFKEIDLKLYNRVECFDFEEVKRLIEQGANPNIHFENDEESSAKSLVSNRCSFFTSYQLIPEFELFEEKGFNQNFDILNLFMEMIQLSANQEILNLLNKSEVCL